LQAEYYCGLHYFIRGKAESKVYCVDKDSKCWYIFLFFRESLSNGQGWRAWPKVRVAPALALSI